MPSAPVRGHFAALQHHPTPVRGENAEKQHISIIVRAIKTGQCR